MNSSAKVFLLSLNCSEALASGPAREDAVLTAELTSAARCGSLPCGGYRCCEEVGETVQECVWGLPQSSTPRTASMNGSPREVWDFPWP